MSVRMGFVYVLHFNEPYAHARHYVGCTRDIRGRLITHAQGRGANLIRVILDAGVGFRLGAMGCTNVRTLRKIERQVKDWKGPAAFCSICNSDPRRIPGTTPYPVEGCPWPTDSESLARLEKEPHIGVRQSSVLDAAGGVNEELKRIMRADKDCLGFIPAGGTEGLAVSLAAGRVFLAFADGRVIGYAAVTHRETLNIHQCVVVDAYRRCGIGSQLVGAARAAWPHLATRAKVRDDLPANDFWSRIGFEIVDHETHETSGSRLNVYLAPPTYGPASVTFAA